MPNWGLYISIDQLGYPRASIRDVVQLASTFNRDASLRIIGMYNLVASVAATKFEGREDGRLEPTVPTVCLSAINDFQQQAVNYCK